ncbi:MAG: hypothetical protein IJK52_11445 [Oscillospiraceae bacterium]|nr:hypothetical protein [Oscillospiraceae bacterium]
MQVGIRDQILMRRKRGNRLGPLVCLVCVLLSGCSLLERQYVTVEPHSRKFWESEAAGTLRAENYQDIVNDLLLLISQRRETATLRLYRLDDSVTVADRLEQATTEIQRQTPLGSYAVSYIASVSQVQRGYHEVKLQIGYRRTAEELQAIVNATSPEALYTLLRNALDRNRTELAVRIGYWGPDGEEQVEDAKARLREDEGLTDFPDWPETLTYPEEGPVGLLEFRLEFPSDASETEPEAALREDAAKTENAPDEDALKRETPPLENASETETVSDDGQTLSE